MCSTPDTPTGPTRTAESPAVPSPAVPSPAVPSPAAARVAPRRRRVLQGAATLAALAACETPSRADGPQAAPSAARSDPGPVAEWLLAPGDAPVDVPRDYLGLHSDHGFNPATPAPTYRYDAVRSLNVNDKDGFPLLHWDQIERAPGRFHWRNVDRWLDLHSDRTRIWVLFGCPPFYQKYPGEKWVYPYLPGGGSPPRDPEAAATMVAKLIDRYPTAFKFVELWNEPNFGWDARHLKAQRWTPESARPGYFTGTPAELAAMARAVRRVLPPSVRLLSGAWEGQWRGGAEVNSMLRFAAASDGAGGVGRDHVQALSVHTYMHREDPNLMIAELRGYRELFARAGFPPRLERYVSECGAEAPFAWTRERPRPAARRAAILRWIAVPAALGFRGSYLYKHSLLETLGDPARDDAIAEAIDEGRELVAGRRIASAARLADGRLWFRFADGDAVF